MPPLDSPADAPWIPHKLHVPRIDGAVLAVPGMDAAQTRLDVNHELLANSKIDLQGRTLPQLRDWSQRACLNAAAAYTSQLSGEDIPAPALPERLIVAGHQPSLFHTGVWMKNFGLDLLARRSGGRAINLVVDNDTIATRSIRVPAGDRRNPSFENIPFDDPQPQQPWENAMVADVGRFTSFGDRVASAMSRWGIDPLLSNMWPDAVACCDQGFRLADCLTAARVRQERRWGLENFELPISRLCELDPFLWFAAHILAQLPRFRDCYNEVLGEYRAVNKVRSRTHPVPELAARDGWLEAPFWIWRTGQTHRSHVFARQAGRQVQLSNGSEIFAVLRLTPDGEACCAVETLRELPRQGLHFRTRALTTTLFSRLCLGDLFIHGIGGAKYDEMTDRIICRFFGLKPPSFLALSATLYLPLGGGHEVTVEDARRLRTLLRELDFNADRHGLGAEAAPLMEEKQQLIAAQASARTVRLSSSERRARRPANRARYRRLAGINDRLARLAEPQRVNVREELRQVEHDLAANSVLLDRAFPFCLYPAETLQRLIARLEETAGRPL